MAEMIWATLVWIIKISFCILWLPFGLLFKNREYVIAVVPYLVAGVTALIAAAFALGLVISVVRWVVLGSLWVYGACKSFIAAFGPAEKKGSEESSASESHEESNASDPYKILGLSPGASFEELSARYRQLISANHPDKVAQLDPEIQAFANERSRRIIEAYELISRAAN